MFLSISILTIIISIILLVFNWRMNKNAVYLSLLFLILTSYGITHYFTLYGKSPFLLAVFFAHFSPFWLLPGPLLYFYVRGTLSDQQGLSWKDSWHFIPAIIHLIGILPYVSQPFSYKLDISQRIIENLDSLKTIQASWLYPSMVSFFMRNGMLILYVIYSAKMLWNFKPSKKELDQIPQKQYQITFRWLILLHATILIAAIGFLFITSIFSQTKVTSELVSAMPVHYISGLAFLLMSTSLLVFPEILYGMPISRLKMEKNGDRKTGKQSLDLKNHSETPSKADEDPFNGLAEDILIYMEKKKPYLNPNFTLTELSIALKAPQHHLSYCFNSILRVKFTDLRTKMRIKHAKELLAKGSAADLSIDGIGKESGFASRSNFYSTFKAETGLTPNEFLGQTDQQ